MEKKSGKILIVDDNTDILFALKLLLKPYLELITTETNPQKIANHARYTFWYVLPTLPMFLVFPLLLARFGFWPALLACVVLTAVCFGLFALALRRFGIELF